MNEAYCYIKDGIISPPQSLPGWWRDPNTGAIYNLKIYDLEQLNELGWYKYIIIGENPEKVLVTTTKEISGNYVIENFITRDFTDEELTDLETARINDLWFEIRDKRDELLVNSDIHVVADKWEVMTSEQKQEWTTYRQALRDLPQNFLNPEDVVWPVSPIDVIESD